MEQSEEPAEHDGKKPREAAPQKPQVVTNPGQHGVDRIAGHAAQEIAIQVPVRLHGPDHRLHG